MQIKFKNGNYKICTDEKTTVAKRGKRAKMYPIDDYMGFKFKWHEKLRLRIYDWWLSTKIGRRRYR